MTQALDSTADVRCLVVDDEDDVAELVTHALSRNGFEVKRVRSGEMAIDLCKEERPDVVILDLDLPGMNGHETATELRKFSDSYILMLSGYGSANDKLTALTSSADDYVSKPFERDELVARVQALMRRPKQLSGSNAKRVQVNTSSRSISIDNKQLTLTVLEFELLSSLAMAMPEMVNKRALIENGWGKSDGATPHILNVHIHNLRRKLDDIDGDLIIESIRGQGFRLLDRKPD